MPQPADTHRTAKDLSPEELEEYSRRLDEHFKNRKVDEALLQRAWHTAHQVANMLYEDFGATQVAVFGSLAERDWFSKGSDIDIAVWGLSGDTYLDALWKTVGFSSEFKIDLVNFGETKGRFRKRLQTQAILIQKEKIDFTILENTAWQISLSTKRKETYKVNKRKLLTRITDEREKIGRVVKEIRESLQDIDEVPVKYRKGQEALLAQNVVNFYTGLENIFKRIAQDIDMHIPTDDGWHKDLLQQMVSSHGLRPPVISQKIYVSLNRILKFRHRFRNIYVFELNTKKVLETAKRVHEIFDNLSTELDMFITCLEKQKSDED
jgi:predicted nucleotidyltransferase